MPEVLKRLVGPAALPLLGGPSQTHRFISTLGTNVGGATGSQLYTVPAGMTVVVRQIVVVTAGPGGVPAAQNQNVYLLWGTSGVDAVYNRFPAPPSAVTAGQQGSSLPFLGWGAMAQGTANTWTLRWNDTLILNAGESIWGAFDYYQTTTQTAWLTPYITIHGIETS